MVRLILIAILILLVARVFWRIIDNIIAGARPAGSGPVAQRGVPMVRDPVCGTFIVPERAISLTEGRQLVYFCSDACRDTYRTRTA
jgi:YHS domain-containing protein